MRDELASVPAPSLLRTVAVSSVGSASHIRTAASWLHATMQSAAFLAGLIIGARPMPASMCIRALWRWCSWQRTAEPSPPKLLRPRHAVVVRS